MKAKIVSEGKRKRELILITGEGRHRRSQTIHQVRARGKEWTNLNPDNPKVGVENIPKPKTEKESE